MAVYFLGDLQGCYEAYQQLLATIAFSPSRDQLYVLGDLVNRGPGSLEVLRHVKRLEGSIHCLLGNHDLHLLAVAHGVRAAHRSDTLTDILQAKDKQTLLDWLRRQPLARHIAVRPGGAVDQMLLVHAGVLPSWSTSDALGYANEVSNALQHPDFVDFLTHMYGNQPAQWSPTLQGIDRLRMITNVLTRLRFCTKHDEMEFDTKEGPGQAPKGFKPWFEFKRRRTSRDLVAFGHWSTLGLIVEPNLLSLDTGCVWGGCLTAVQVNSMGETERLIQIPCAPSQKPGAAYT